jgi:SnoaL-like domain
MDRLTVANWLEKYVQAWKSYDAAEIGALFSYDARYFYGPYDEPLIGREAIIASWRNPASRDTPGTYDAHYETVMMEGNRAIANGRSRYFEADGVTPRAEFDNIFLLTFDDSGLCTEFREWFMQQPNR